MNSPTIKCLQRDELSVAMKKAAEPYEKQFQEKYDVFLYFSKELFAYLHKSDGNQMSLPPEVTVASKEDASILLEMDVFKNIANSSFLEVEMKKKYFVSLLSVYNKLINNPRLLAKDSSTLCVGIEREGRILAEGLDCLPENRSLTPSGKRIPFNEGLIIGLRNVEPPMKKYNQCLIIDGAIASGGTLMALMWQWRHAVKSFSIYSVHGPVEGLRGIIKFAKELGLTISLDVGHATAGLNEKFYAINPSDGTLVLGDIGDTISDLNNPSKVHG